MQSSYWGYWLVVMGVAIIGLMISVQGITTNTTQDNYAIREIVEASMLEAVDYAYYRDYNEIKMNKEKFMEVFIRMTAEVMGTTDTYEVNFYDIYEAPPKVSVEVRSNSGTNFISAGDYDTITRIDAIIQIFADEVGDSNNGAGEDNDGNTGTGEDNNTTAGDGDNTGEDNNITAGDGDNTGSEYSMPSAMHELSTEAIKYYSPAVSKTASNYSTGMLNSEGAQKLSNYMMNDAGLTDLASEWWHYQDNACYNRIRSASSTGASFWSAV